MIGPDPNFEVFDENAEIALKQISELLEGRLPEGYAFMFIMATHGPNGNTFYTANIHVEDAINLLAELVEKLKHA